MCTRSSVIVIALALAAGCGGQTSSGSRPPRPVSDPAGVLHLKPGRHTYHLGRDVRVGQSIRCFTRDGAPAGGGSVQPRGHGVGSSTGFEAITTASGRVRVVCPAHPGNA